MTNATGEAVEWVDGDYPTDAALKRIESWPYWDLPGCLDFVASIWHWPDFGVSNDLRPEEAHVVGAEARDKYLRLATGGWSGNEEIVAAMKTNYMLRAMCWRMTARGGLHVFQYPERSDVDGGQDKPSETAPPSKS